ncbi:glycosyltransferase [Agromyces sp. SYSU K20354]|uniref:glycosyltransferase family 2 protein n=1 Tax=Agromyces cavernae TaxID=2898659 RepID=UPI001E29DFB3|nr:glycosyltransferase family 2 protein [Agromyces cavernae]MCD2444034.1 glycosyltransferase [Agromyces cavernae]
MGIGRRLLDGVRAVASAGLAPVRRRRGRRAAAAVPDASRRGGWVDIVVPVHDVERLIDATIRSVLSQDHWRLNLIVLNDASIDGTAERVVRWAARDSRVRLVRVEHRDPNATRNAGVALAEGEFLTFLDGDDVLRPGALRDLVGSLDTSGADFAVASYDRLERGRRTPPAFWIDEAHAVDRPSMSVEQFPAILVNAVQWTKLYRRSFWDAAGLSFPEGGHFQDQLVSASAFARAGSFDVLSRKTVDWRIRADGSSMTQQGVRSGQVRDRFATALGALDVLADESTEAVHRARITQFLSNDAAIAAAELPGMGDEAFAALRDGLAGLAALADEEIWAEVPAESKVLYEFVLRDDRERALEYLRRGGLDLLRHPLTEIDGVRYVQLPFWDDGEADVPRSRFRAAPRELRAFADQAVARTPNRRR